MAEMDRPAVLRQLRQLPGSATVFVTAVSGYGADEEKAERVNFDGFDARLQKPVELAELQALLASAKLDAKV